jgi:hypothetical protein
LLSFGAESFVFQIAIQKYKMKIYRTIIFPVAFYWCETCSLTLRTECRLRAFENRMLHGVWGTEFLHEIYLENA